ASYTEHPVAGWIPEKWQTQKLIDGKIVHELRAERTSFECNVAYPATDFVWVKPGTVPPEDAFPPAVATPANPPVAEEIQAEVEENRNLPTGMIVAGVLGLIGLAVGVRYWRRAAKAS
ncbi:MAG: hypothetical protein ACRCZF_19575, partial [Gemmataceae bacterium]